MKKWTAPQIVVDSFSANEYVSSCIGFATGLGSNGYYFWDIYNNGQYDTEGVGDNRYSTSHEWLRGPGPTMSVPDDVPTGWYNNKTLYGDFSLAIGFFELYYRFQDPQGTYRVYVFNDGTGNKAYIYKSDYYPAGKPTAQHQFS